MPATDAVPLAQQQYAARQAVVTAAATVAATRWAQVNPAAIAPTWQAQAPIVAAGVTGAQLAATQSADPYVTAAMVAQGMAPAAEGALVSGALAGVAADGRDLISLLYQPAITALVAIRGGADPTRAMAMGLSQLDTIVRTEVADAGRTADQIAQVVHGAPGYVRMVVGQTCHRCILLAGRWYRYSAGFERHPRCDCVMIPAGEGDEPLTSPEAVYADMTPEERTRAGWTKADQSAIDLGADIFQVTNVHRTGVYTAGGRQFTRESTTKRGSSPGVRLTPRQIFIDSHGDRDEALRLLSRYGYTR